jgi:hypothetical protein
MLGGRNEFSQNEDGFPARTRGSILYGSGYITHKIDDR